MKVRFNINTNFRGTVYSPGDETDLTKEDIKLFDGTGASGIPHIILLNEDGSVKRGSKGKSRSAKK